jgi:hypothetical protein
MEGALAAALGDVIEVAPHRPFPAKNLLIKNIYANKRASTDVLETGDDLKPSTDRVKLTQIVEFLKRLTAINDILRQRHTLFEIFGQPRRIKYRHRH